MPKAVFDGIYRDLRKKVQDGTYPYRSFLPPENELVSVYGCSRNTLRRALGMLADEAFVQPLHGKGYRVIWRRDRGQAVGALGDVESFEEYARKNGLTPTTHVVLFERLACDADLSLRTGFEEGDVLVHVVRTRELDGVARQIDDNYFLESATPGLTPEIASQSIYRYLEQELGMRILTVRRTITVRLADEVDRRYMDLGPYGCVVVMENQAYNSDGIQFEYTETSSHPDTFCYRVVARR